MVKGVWVFEVAEEKQEEYLNKTREVIKPYWEAHECTSYQVYRDITNPRRFLKEQHYPDKETMDRSLNLALNDPQAKEIIGLFGKFAENIVRMRCITCVE